jgi:hypothetical protein
MPVTIAVLVTAWVVAVTGTRTRNVRFLAGLSAWSVAWVLIGALSWQFAWILRSTLVAVAAYALVRPADLGLGSLTRAESTFDKRLHTASGLLDTFEYGAANAELAHLADDVPLTDPYWRVTIRLFLRYAARRGSNTVASLTPSTAMREAARGYWRAALWKRVLGTRQSPSTLDEEVALRCYHETFSDLIPRAALTDHPVVPMGAWFSEAERLIDELAVIRMEHAVTELARVSLTEAMYADLVIARGERSDGAIREQAAAAEQMREMWRRLGSERGLDQGTSGLTG